MLPLSILHRASTDGGRTWSAPRVLDVSPQVAPTPCANPVLRLATGELAQPFETMKEYDDAAEATSGAWLALSPDDGATWPTQVLVARDPDNARWFWDQRLAVRAETARSLRCAGRATWRPSGICPSTSRGAPRTDGPGPRPISTGLPGQHCQPVSLGGGRLLAVWSHRELPGIVISISEDFGRTWDRYARRGPLPERPRSPRTPAQVCARTLRATSAR